MVSCYLHNPFFGFFGFSSKARSGCIVFNPKQNVATFQIQQGYDLSGKPLWSYVVSLELQPRVLTIQ